MTQDQHAGGSRPGMAGGAARPRRRWSVVTETVMLVIVALTVALVVKTFVVQPFYIPSGSMEDTIVPADRILVNKVVYHIRSISRGDIVVFSGAGSWDSPPVRTRDSRSLLVRAYDDSLGRLLGTIEGLFGSATGQTDYVKRVIGLPGDHVSCCNAKGQITVNGVALNEKPYLIPGAGASQGRFSIVVPPGRLWVMGDNRPISEDSRLHDCAYALADKCYPWDRDGTIPESAVIGRAFMIVWPPSRIRVLPVPATFGQQGLQPPVAVGALAAVPWALARRRAWVRSRTRPGPRIACVRRRRRLAASSRQRRRRLGRLAGR